MSRKEAIKSTIGQQYASPS